MEEEIKPREEASDSNVDAVPADGDAQTQPADMNTVVSPPLRGRARLKAKFLKQHPDIDYDDDENFDNALEEYDTERQERLEAYDEFDNKLRSAIEKDSRSGQFVYNLLDGMPILENLIDVAGPELRDIVNSDEARARYEQLRQEAKELEAAREANFEQSQAMFDTFLADKDPKDVEKFDDYILSFFNRLAEGEFTENDIRLLWDGMMHDKDVAEATESGAIMGRNEKIVAKRKDIDAGDGVPALSSLSSTDYNVNTRKQSKPFNIWEAGKQMQ